MLRSQTAASRKMTLLHAPSLGNLAEYGGHKCVPRDFSGAPQVAMLPRVEIFDNIAQRHLMFRIAVNVYANVSLTS